MSEPHKPTEENRRLIRTLAGIGVPQKMMAVQIGIDAKTLAKHYDDDIRIGESKANTATSCRLTMK